MKHRAFIFSAALTSLLLSFMYSLPALAVSTPVYCFCQFYDIADNKMCRNETTLGTQLPNVDVAVGDLGPFTAGSDLNTQCSNWCHDHQTNGTNATKGLYTGPADDQESDGIASSKDAYCDIDPGPDFSCKTARNAPKFGQNAYSCNYCFCKYPDSFKTADCKGKTTLLKVTVNPNQCASDCQTAGLEPAGAPTSDYNAECDFIVSGDTCLQNSKQTKNDTCTSAAQASQNAKASALAQASEGSVIGLPLPIGQRSIPTVIGLIVNRVMGVVGAIAFLMFVYGGFSWMMAAGNEERIKHARQIIVWAALGMVVIFAAYGITKAIIQITTPIGS